MCSIVPYGRQKVILIILTSFTATIAFPYRKFLVKFLKRIRKLVKIGGFFRILSKSLFNYIIIIKLHFLVKSSYEKLFLQGYSYFSISATWEDSGHSMRWSSLEKRLSNFWSRGARHHKRVQSDIKLALLPLRCIQTIKVSIFDISDIRAYEMRLGARARELEAKKKKLEYSCKQRCGTGNFRDLIISSIFSC